MNTMRSLKHLFEPEPSKDLKIIILGIFILVVFISLRGYFLNNELISASLSRIMYAIGMTGWIIGALAMVNYLRWYFNPKTEVIIYYSNNSLSKKIVESYLQAVSGFLRGIYRIEVYSRKGKSYKRLLQSPNSGGWKTEYTHTSIHWPCLRPEIRHVQNASDI